MVVCEQHEHCPYMNMMFKMVIVSMKMFVMIKVPIDMIMVLKIGIEQIEPCPYLIVMYCDHPQFDAMHESRIKSTCPLF